MLTPELVYDEEKNVAYAGGIIIPLGRKPVAPATVVENLKRALALDYEGPDPRYQGLTKNEAIARIVVDQAELKDMEAIKYLHDRLIGKPVQQVNSMNVSTTLQEFLDGIDIPLARGQREIDPFES